MSLVDNLIFFGIGVLMLIGGLASYRKRSLIQNIPTSKIRSIAMGLVEIFGEVVPTKEKLLKSPFTNKDCVYYKYVIEERRRTGSGHYKSSAWKKIKEGSESVRFFLKDNTGQVLVEPKGAAVDIPADHEFRLGTKPNRYAENFFNSINFRYKGFLGLNRNIRYKEYFIQPKEKIYVLGTAGDNPYKEEATAHHSIEDIMIQKGKTEKTYYILDRPEKKTLTHLTFQTLGGLGLGIVFMLIGLFFILTNL